MKENNKTISSAWDKREAAFKRYDEGNKLGALILLLNLDEDGESDIKTLQMTGDIYFEFELYEYALEYFFRYLNAGYKSALDLGRAYNAISACYCRMHDVSLMTYYYEEQLKIAGSMEFGYDDVIFEYYDEINAIHEQDEGFHSVDNIPCDKALWEASVFLTQNMFEEAYKRLITVTKNSDRYVDARINMALCLSSLDKKDEAIEVLRALAEDFSDDVAAQISYAAFLIDENRTTEAKHYLLKAADIPTDNEEDCLRTAELLLKYYGEEDKALKKLNECLNIVPYNVDALMFKGQIYFNRDQMDEAIDSFKLCYDLTRSTAAKYYYEKSLEKAHALFNGSKRRTEKLDYNADLPSKEGIRLFKLTNSFINNFYEKNPKKFSRSEVKEIVDWVFSYPNEMQAEVALCLMRFGSKKYAKYFTEKLLSTRVITDAKFSIVQGLLDTTTKVNVSACMRGIMMHTKLVRCTFDKGLAGDRFETAYNLALSRICFFDDYTKSLTEAAQKLFSDIKKVGRLNEADDVEAIAGAMLYLMNYKEALKQGYFEQMLETSKKRVEKVIELRNEK